MSHFEDCEEIRRHLAAHRTGVALVKDLLTGDVDHGIALVAPLTREEVTDVALALASQAAGYLAALEGLVNVDATEYLAAWAVRMAAMSGLESMDGPETPGRLL